MRPAREELSGAVGVPRGHGRDTFVPGRTRHYPAMTEPHPTSAISGSAQPVPGALRDRAEGTNPSPLTPAQVLTILLRYRRALIGIPAVLFAATVLTTLLGTRTYTSTVSFTPVPSLASAGALSGIAAQIGVALPGQNPEDSPLFYGNLIRTNSFLTALAMTSYTFRDADSTRTGTFIAINEIEENTPELTLHEAIRLLREENVSVSPDRQTGIVTVRVKADWPDLAVGMAQRTVELVNAHNQSSRRGNATATRDFLSTRLDSAETTLRAAEDALEGFLKRNRDFRTDPSLTFEHERLSREVTLQRDIYATLVQAREQARLEAVRNTPSITLVEPPSLPLRPDRRFLVFKALFALIFGTIAGLGYVFAREVIRSNPASGHDAEALQDAWQGTKQDLAKLRLGRATKR